MSLPLKDGEFYITVNGRFVHRSRNDGPGKMNTACGANPSYYHGLLQEPCDGPTTRRPSYPHGSRRVTPEQAERAHVCGKCWPREP